MAVKEGKGISPEQLAASGTEHGHQAALFCWAADPNVRAALPELQWLFAIPNGGLRNPVTANRLKATGVKKGVMDICLLVRRVEYAALWIELKRPKSVSPTGKKRQAGKVSEDQQPWLDQARACGHGAVSCVGWEAARDMIIQYLNYGQNK